MTASAQRERALRPEDLGRLFLERANAGDVEGVVALYEPAATLAFPPGQLAAGHAAIREVYAGLLASRPVFTSEGQRPPVRNGDLALTSTRLAGGGATVEVARRQPDGTWLWAIDQPALLSALPGRPRDQRRCGQPQHVVSVGFGPPMPPLIAASSPTVIMM